MASIRSYEACMGSCGGGLHVMAVGAAYLALQLDGGVMQVGLCMERYQECRRRWSVNVVYSCRYLVSRGTSLLQCNDCILRYMFAYLTMVSSLLVHSSAQGCCLLQQIKNEALGLCR